MALVARGICREPDFASAGGACVSLDEIKEVHSQFQETAWVTGLRAPEFGCHDAGKVWKYGKVDWNLGIIFGSRSLLGFSPEAS